ncbi:hypothetical protein TB1_033460 [Malus domestica]
MSLWSILILHKEFKFACLPTNILFFPMLM